MDERKDIKEGVASELKKLFCKASVYLKKGREGLVHYSKVLTIKSDISLLKSDRRVIYRKLGEDAYKAIKEGRIDLPESKVTIERIDRIEDSIKEKNDKIERLGKEGQSLKAEKEILKTKEKVEVKEAKEEKAQEKPSTSFRIATPEKEKTDLISTKLEQEEPSLNIEKKIKETKEEVEIKEEKEEKAQEKPSKTARKTTSGEKKKTRKTPARKTVKMKETKEEKSG